MLRLSLGLLLVCVACGKDVDDPSFDNTATNAGSSSGSSGSGGSEGTASVSSTNPTTGDSAEGNSAEDAAEGSTTGGGGSTGGPTSDTNGACGDGAISPGEQCDGDDLQNFDCMSLGLSGGTLSCDPMTCTFDTSMCMSTSGGTSS